MIAGLSQYTAHLIEIDRRGVIKKEHISYFVLHSPSEEQLQHPLPEWVLLLPLEKSLAGSAEEITHQ